MAPVRNVFRYHQIAKQDKHDKKNRDFDIFQQKYQKYLMASNWNFMCYYCKGTYDNFLIWSYEDNRLLQLEAVVF